MQPQRLQKKNGDVPLKLQSNTPAGKSVSETPSISSSFAEAVGQEKPLPIQIPFQRPLLQPEHKVVSNETLINSTKNQFLNNPLFADNNPNVEANKRVYINNLAKTGVNKAQLQEISDGLTKNKKLLSESLQEIKRYETVPESNLIPEGGNTQSQEMTIRAANEFILSQQKRGNVPTELYFNAGSAYLGLNKPDEAIEMFKNTLNTLGNQADSPYGMLPQNELAKNTPITKKAFTNPASSFFGIGAALAQKGNHEEAINNYNEALKLDPENINAKKGLVYSEYKLGNKEGSAENLKQLKVLEQNAKPFEAMRGQIEEEAVAETEQQRQADYMGDIAGGLEAFVTGYDPQNKLKTLGYLNPLGKIMSGIQEGAKTIGEGVKQMGVAYVAQNEKEKLSAGLTMIEGGISTAFASMPAITGFNAGISALKDAVSLLPEEGAKTGTEAIEGLEGIFFGSATLFANSLGYNPEQGGDMEKALHIGDVVASFAMMGGAHKALNKLTDAIKRKDVAKINEIKTEIKNAENVTIDDIKLALKKDGSVLSKEVLSDIDKQAQRDVEIKQAQKNRAEGGTQDVGILNPIPASVSKTIEKMNGDKISLPSQSQLNYASNYIYSEYKRLQALKADNTRMFTTDQINESIGQLDRALTQIEEFKVKRENMSPELIAKHKELDDLNDIVNIPAVMQPVIEQLKINANEEINKLSAEAELQKEDEALKIVDENNNAENLKAIEEFKKANPDNPAVINLVEQITPKAEIVPEVKVETPIKGNELAIIVNPVNVELKNNKIEGKLFNEQEAKDYQKLIESKYNDSGIQKFGQENEDIRQNMFSYDQPIAEKDINGVNVRIAEGLIEGEPYSGNRRKTYLLYADGKVAGKFYSVSDAKQVVKFIEDNLVKQIGAIKVKQGMVRSINELKAEVELMKGGKRSPEKDAKIAEFEKEIALQEKMGIDPNKGRLEDVQEVVGQEALAQKTPKVPEPKVEAKTPTEAKIELIDQEFENIINQRPENEQLIIELPDNAKQEPVIANIERKAQSDSEAERLQAIEGAKQVIAQYEGNVIAPKPLLELLTDEKRFQGREDKYSKESVVNILGNYDASSMNPILFWRDANGKDYVLAGHSRRFALNILSKLVEGKELTLEESKLVDQASKEFNITKEQMLAKAKEQGFNAGIAPESKEFKGTEREAIDKAEASNARAAMQKPVENAGILSRMRKNGASEKEVEKKLQELAGRKDRVFTENISYLSEGGNALANLKVFKEAGDRATEKYIEKVADWIGAARKKYSGLTDAHEQEMYDFLQKNKTIRERNDFVEKVGFLLKELKDGEPLNFEHRAVMGYNESRITKEKKEVIKKIEDLEKDRKKPQTEQRLTEISNEIGDLNKKLAELNKDLINAKAGDELQINLFEPNPEYSTSQKLSELDKRIGQVAKAREAKAKELSKRIKEESQGDMFGKPQDAQFQIELEADVSKENFKKQLSIFDNEIEALKRQKEELLKQQRNEKELEKNQTSLFEPGQEKINFPEETGEGSGEVVRFKRNPTNVSGLKKLAKNVISNIESKYNAFKQINLYARNTKIESVDDAAFIFRALETQKSENFFVIHVREDGSFVAQHLSTGSHNQTVAGALSILDGIKRFKTKQLYTVHNHPSGSLKASGPDFSVHSNFKKALPTGVELMPSIIINLDSGKYVIFEGENISGEMSKTEQIRDVPTGDKKFKVKPLAFSRQVLHQPSSNWGKISSSKDAAEYLSNQKRGVDKTQVIVMNNNNMITGVFFSKGKAPKAIADEIGEFASGQNANNVIISSSKEISRKDLNELIGHLKAKEIKLLDHIIVRSENGIIKNYESLGDEGRLEESPSEYKGGGKPKSESEINKAKDAIKKLSEKYSEEEIKGMLSRKGYSESEIKDVFASTKKTGKALSGGETKKTVVTIRAYEGVFREGVKKELEKLGLTREIENQAEAEAKGKEFVEKVGEETALQAVRNNDIEGGMAAVVWNDLVERVEKKLATEKDPQKIMELEAMEAQLLNEWGKQSLSSGRFNAMHNRIYQTSDLGYNLQNKIQNFKDQNKGEIPAEVEAKFRAIDAELKDVRTKLIEAEEKSKKATEKSEELQAIIDIKESVERDKKQQITSAKIKQATDRLVAKVREGKLQRPNAFSAATPGSIVWDGALEVVAKTVKATGKVAEAVAKGMEHIAASEWYKNLTADKQSKAEKAYRDYFIDKEEVTEGKIKIPHSVIRDLVESGIDNINDLVNELRSMLPEELADKTDREIRDAVTNYGKRINMNKEQIEVDIRKMKRIGKLISAIEDVQNKKRPLRSGLQRDKLDANERAMQKELRELMKELPVDEELQAEQQKTATDTAKQRLRNQIEDLQREIDKGEKIAKSARTVKDDAELKDLKEQRDKKKEEYDEKFKDDEFKEKKRLEQTKKRTEQRIEYLQKRIQTADFSKKIVKPLIADTELTKLRAEKIRLQEEYDKEFYKYKIINRTRGEKIKNGIWEAWGLTRLLSATGEFSFIGVQGLIQSIAHPTYAKEAFKTAMRSFASESKTQQWLNNIKAQEWYPELKQSKLALTEVHAEVKAREELYVSDYANMIWNVLGLPLKLKSKTAFEKWKTASPFSAFERAAVGYLDTLRVMRFLDGKKMLEENGISFAKNPEAYKEMADVINTMTGRASLGAAEQIAPALTKIFFSPRNWASLFKTATPYAFYHFGKMRSSAEGFKPSVAQKMAISDFSKYLGLTTSMIALATAYFNNDDDEETSVEFDPTSSDFGKIKIGDTRVDPWGGRIQQVVLLSRFISESIKDGQGETIPLGVPFKTPTRKDLLIEMATNKLAPSASMIEKYLSSRIDEQDERVTKYGQPYEFSEELKEKLHPIYWGTVNDLLKDDVTALDGLLLFYAFFGGGVNVYEK